MSSTKKLPHGKMITSTNLDLSAVQETLRALQDGTANSAISSSTYPPILLSTLPNHQEWLETHDPDVFHAHGPADNKLETHVHEMSDEAFFFCHLVSMNPFTRNNGKSFHQPAYESAMAIMLAIQHLNTGDPSIIPELAALAESCPIQFSVEFVDTEFDVGIALNRVIAITHPHINITKEEASFQQAHRLEPCAFLGASRSAVSGPTSIITGLEDYVQLSGESTSGDLDDRIKYPRFARVIPSDADTVQALVLFLTQELGLTHLAVMNINDSFGNAYATMIRDAARQYAPELEILQIPMDHRGDYSIPQEDIARAVSALNASQFLYSVVILLDTKTHDDFMLEAHRQGLAGSRQHNFMFTDGFDFSTLLLNRSFDPDDPLFQAYSGAGIIQAGGGLPGEEKLDTLARKLRAIKKSVPDMHYVASILPGNPFLEDEAVFDQLNPHQSFNFDATILMGLSVCAAAMNSDLILSGTALYNQLSRTSFDGLTGTIVLDPQTKTRVANSSYFKIWNLVGAEIEGGEGVNRTAKFQAPLTHMFAHGQWNSIEPFVFNDGTTMNPENLRAVTVETNPIHPITRAVVLLFCAFAVVAAIACAVWTWHNREKRIVRASQPFFLILVCFGTAVFATTIIPLSFDGGNLSKAGLDQACTAIVWLVSLGVAIIFSALFSKTHRVRKVIRSAQKYKRIKVTVRETFTPIAILLSVNIVILSVMTALHAVEYSVRVLSRDQFEREIETYGTCAFEDSKAYIFPLFIMNVAVILLTLIEAWLARNLSTEFQESEYIFRVATMIVVLVCIGLPVIIMARGTPDACIFIASAVVFLICMDVLWMLFVPKMRYKEKTTKLTISGLTLSSVQHEVLSFPASATSGNGDVSDDDTTSHDGERILATKDRHELAEEVALLKKLLRAKHCREQALRSGCLNDGSDCRYRDEKDHTGNFERAQQDIATSGDGLELSDAAHTFNQLSKNGGRE